MVNIEVVDLFEMNNFVSENFFRFSYILSGKLDF